MFKFKSKSFKGVPWTRSCIHATKRIEGLEIEGLEIEGLKE
jgi:hypothetical protein